jgi:hypothetical protein
MLTKMRVLPTGEIVCLKVRRPPEPYVSQLARGAGFFRLLFKAGRRILHRA